MNYVKGFFTISLFFAGLMIGKDIALNLMTRMTANSGTGTVGKGICRNIQTA